jgi:hypothetical protein
MKLLSRRLFVSVSLLSVLAPSAGASPTSLKLLTQFGYLPANPVLVRIEALTVGGERDRDLWDAEATLTTSGGITLSTNKVTLRNGMGSALVTFSGGGDFTLIATLGSLSANRSLRTLASVPVTTVSGTLAGSATTWSNVINVTADVTVPVGHTLTIQSNTLVLMNGVPSGTAGTRLLVNGTINSLGTEAHPVTITCANAAQRWGQIRHDNAQSSLYRHTMITRAGRSVGEGHTGQAPVIRPNNSTITFEECSLTDHADANGTPGKIGYGINSDLTFRNCLVARSRTGPEIQGTALLCTNTWFIDMRGPDDADGIYLHGQQVGQQIKISGCVFAGGDDDGIDTLDSVVNIDNTILRDWNSVVEDAKAISVFNGATHLRRCLITDSTVGVAAKWSGGSATTVTINHSTITGNGTNVLAQIKGNAPGPLIDYRITNSVLWGGDAVQSDFGPTNFTIVYSDISEPWSGLGNLNSTPLFVDAALKNFHLLTGSPCINTGDPASPNDPDSSRADMGVFPFDAASGNGLFVSINSPANNAVFTSPANIAIDATATSTTGSVAKVEFYQGALKLGEDMGSPFGFVWNSVVAGFYSLTAVVIDTTGFSRTSAPVNIVVNASGAPATNTLISLGSSWKYLDDGSDQGAGWVALPFDDSSWSNGVAQLGYGDNDEATVVRFGPNPGDKYPTTYFRRAFTVADPARVQGLVLSLLRDDGAVVYLNGQEVYRVTMPEGPIGYRTYATTAGEYVFEGTNPPPGLLVAGTNILAAEVHQGNSTSSDLSFELELLAIVAASTNLPPIVSLTAPPNNTTLAAPGSAILAALASDSDGTVTNVAFYANGTKLGDDVSFPYSFGWNGIAAGTYPLTAVATDNTGLSATSGVVTLTVSTNVAPPLIISKSPAPGSLTILTQINVTFSKPVLGVNASDFLIAGSPASGVTGSGSNYVFRLTQPPYGTVPITWAGAHGIVDVFTPPNVFNTNSAGANWQYQLLDAAPPTLTSINPVPGSTVATLAGITLLFSEPVNGVNASDLRINSVPAATLTGSGAGPYTFGFLQPALGAVQISWNAAHGIQDTSGNPFAASPWSYTLNTNAVGVVISEIMYHPSSENVLEEYIELFNKGASAVNLNGWRFSGGVQFTFPNVSIPAGGYLVVAADTNVFKIKYPGVNNVIGNWTGFLNNSGEDVDLDDAQGDRADSVTYADEGDWAIRQRGPLDLGHRGWVWFKEHDGLGKSLELINPDLSNNEGQNWRASILAQGTPGTVNSVFTNNIAPMILDVIHSPVVPRSTDPLLVTARIVDESAGGATVTLDWRTSIAAPPPFTTVAMNDSGVNGDAAAGDGIYSVQLPAQANNTVIEFYVTAADAQGRTRAWPAPAIDAEDVAQPRAPLGQVANALFQVDDSTYAGSQPLYKLVMTEAERAELQAIPSQSNPQGPNSQMNGTFISFDAGGASRHYLTGIRNRGHGSRTANPPNYRVNFRTDDRWKDVTAINLNIVQVHIQHLGSLVARKAGVTMGETIPVQVRVNNQNRASGSYAANEVIDGDWAAKHFPDDGNGNIYRAVRDIAPPDFSYRGETPSSYQNTWFKQSNVSEDDWTDLIGMLRVAGINNATSFTTENVRQVINVEQWIRHLALMNLMGNNESGLNNGFNDDYSMYRGVLDPRFILIPYDLDQILGQGGSFGPTVGIFTATANNGAGQALDRFLRWPDFEPIYYRTLKELLDTTLSQANFNALVDQALPSYVAPGTINAIKNWMGQRRTFVLSILPPITPTNPPIATITGTPRSPTPLTGAMLTIGGNDIVSYRRSLDSGAYGAETPIATPINLSGLANGAHIIAVIGKNSTGSWQEQTNATVRSWVVNPAWPAVRLNEVLARNVTAFNHSGTFPDAIELFNEGSTSVDLSGLRLTDDPATPGKFTFPATTTLGAGARLVVFANNPDATPGFHLGFSLDQDGDGVYLFSRAVDGNIVLDSVVFGLQLADLTIGRISGGDWMLNTPTLNAANGPRALGDPRGLKINEWQAVGVSPMPDDFIELFNPDANPVALGGLHLTDQPIGAPALSPIVPLSFIAGGGYAVFIADGDGDKANHVNFGLALEQGEIGLTATDRSVIDCVIYGPQQIGISSGRCPDGALGQKSLVLPTPGSPNACLFDPPPPAGVNLVAISNIWRFEESGTDLGTGWFATGFDDSGWSSGAAVLAREDAGVTPEPIRTPLTVANGKITFYFRTHFNLPAGLNITSLEATHLTDDGAVFYINGTEAGRFNMPAAPAAIEFNTLAPGSHEANVYEATTLAMTNLVTGDNVLAVEVHQSSAGSTDIVFGMRLDALSVTNSPALAGVLINEVLANNATLEEPDGSKPDWVELYNPSSNAVDIAGMSLTDSTLTPQRWILPVPSIILALGYLRVRLDPDLPASNTNAGFGLKANGGAVYLYNRPQDGGAPASSVTYGLQAADFSLGRVPNGGTNWVLTLPTFGAANIAAALGDPLQLKINEWMAAPAGNDEDWFEIYNPNVQPVSLSQMWVSDSVTTPKYRIPERSFIGAAGYLRLWAANGADADFTGFSLNAGSEAVALFTAGGVFLHGFSWNVPQQNGISEGLLPDGSANRVYFITTPTPGNANFLPLTNVLINELLAHSDPPLEDAVEIFNPTGDDVDISGWYLSDSQNDLLKYRLPAGSIVPANGFKVFYEYQFNDPDLITPFSFSSAKGDEVYLSQSTSPGTLTGYRAFAEFGASENGVSFGRYQTSIGVDITALSARTFGMDNPATTNQFRTGTGKTNVYPKVGPVVINEIMYHYPGDTNDILEFVELHNILGTPISLFDPANPANTWRLRRGIDFDFPLNTTIPAGGFLVLVNFDPVADPVSLAAFRAAYGTNMILLGPYGGKLDNGGEDIELRRPDAPQTIPGPDFGLVPYIVVDRLVYDDVAPWPATPDGLGDSLKRLSASLYGNDPVNWSGGAPSPGAANFAAIGTNTPPVLVAVGNKTVTEGVLLSFTATATDTNVPAQALTFSLDAGFPAGASITPAGAFAWSPSEAHGPGVYPVTIRVTDNGSPVLSDFETIQITVLETNNAPVLTPIGNKTGNEGSLITFTADATDSDDPVQTLTYTIEGTIPSGASMTTAGVFTWTPTEAQGPGVFPITVRVTDNGSPNRSVTETIQITVNELNTAPVLAAIGNRTVNEGSLLTFAAAATDADAPAQTLVFALDPGAPAGASITTGGVFTWTSGETQGPSNYVVTVRVTDNGPGAATDFETITITVNEVNVAPVLAAIGNKSVNEDSLLTFTAIAMDSDLPAQMLSFALDSGAPSGASITAGGVFTWTPGAAQGPSNYVVTIRVTDKGTPALDDFETININVTETAVPTTLVNFTNAWRHNTSGSNLLTGWKETAFDDSNWSSARAVFFNETGSVIPAPTNTFLSLTGTFGQRITNYYFRTRFFLPADAAGVSLTANNVLDDGCVIYLNGVEAQRINMPTGAVFATTFSAASWEANTIFVTNVSAANLLPGENVLAVEVHQQSATSTDVVFGLSLTALVPPMTPIAITSQPTNLVVITSSSAQFSVGVTGSSPFYQWFKNGSPINGANAATYNIASASAGDAGTYSVMVSNLTSSATSGNATLTVNPPANSPPVLAAVGNRSVNESNLLTFTATAIDPQSPTQTLTFTLDAGAPAGASITPGGVFTWTPHETNGPGIFPVTVRVTDNGSPALDDSETISIAVNEVNLPPVLAAIGNRTITAGSNLTFTATATDPDRPAQSLAFTLDAGAPAGAGINPSSGLFTWTPSIGHVPTTNQVTVRVTDNGSTALNDFETFNIIIAGPPRIISITVTPAGLVTVQWASFAGKTYRVEYKSDLSSGTWLQLGGNVLATGAVSSVTDNVGANTRRFYQVRLMD